MEDSELKAKVAQLERQNEASLKAVVELSKCNRVDEISIPLPGGLTAKMSVPRPMTEAQWDYLMDIVAKLKAGCVEG